MNTNKGVNGKSRNKPQALRAHIKNVDFSRKKKLTFFNKAYDWFNLKQRQMLLPLGTLEMNPPSKKHFDKIKK